jgi:hypothetical protein
MSLPVSGTISAVNRIELSPESPHWDFGSGLAPFVEFSLPQDVKTLSLVTKPFVSAGLRGGDGRWYFPATKAIFLDKNRRMLPEQSATPRNDIEFATPVKIQNLEVPDAATSIVITSIPSDAGKSGKAQQINIGMPALGGGRYYDIEYVLSIYGDAELRTHPATSPR